MREPRVYCRECGRWVPDHWAGCRSRRRGVRLVLTVDEEELAA